MAFDSNLRSSEDDGLEDLNFPPPQIYGVKGSLLGSVLQRQMPPIYLV